MLPIHPFIVHFPIAAWTIGSVFLAVAVVLKRERWEAPAWILLGIGALGGVFAALTGQAEFQRLGETGHRVLSWHRNLGIALPWLMVATVLAKAHFTFARKARPLPAWIWCCLAAGIAVLVLYNGYLGGVLVYRLGLGNRQIP